MKCTLRNILLLSLGFFALVSPLQAGTDGAASEGSLLLVLFIGFFALIVVFQLVPACLMFFGMVKGLLGRKDVQGQRSTADR